MWFDYAWFCSDVDCGNSFVDRDVWDSLRDISKAHTGFGYAPWYGMEDGLEETIRWFGREGIKAYVEWVNLEYPIIKAHEKWIPWLKQR